MRKKILLAIFSFSILLGGIKISEAAPVYTDQDAKTYFNEYYNLTKKNGYQDLADQGTQLFMVNLRVTKINREIIGAQNDYPAQFYMNYLGKEFKGQGESRPGQKWDKSTYSIQEKLNYVGGAINGQSQVMFPILKTRLAASGYSEDWESDFNMAPVTNANFDKDQAFAQPQGFMYAEADSNGANSKVKQFIYGKDAAHFKVMWNKETESIMYIALEQGATPDKMMIIRADVDEVYRLIRVSGELFYFGEDNKQFTVLNQMVYDHEQYLKMSAYETYGKRKGFMMPNPEKNANIVIRTDLEDGPNNWTIKEFPFAIENQKPHYKNARGVEASDPNKFLSAFNPPNLDGKGMESNPDYATNGQKLTEERKLTYTWDGKENSSYGTYATNSVYMKSRSMNLEKGKSLKLAYGFEPTTRYKVPSLVPISNAVKNEQDDYETRIKWMDAVTGSMGGEIQFFVDGKPVEITVDGKKYSKYPYEKNGDVDGEFDVKIDSKWFKPGVRNKVTVEIKDELLIKDPIKLKPEEHSSSREFNVDNKRLIPINYVTSKGNVLETNDTMTTFVNLMDNDKKGVSFDVPATMTDKNYPLEKTDPTNEYVSKENTTLTIKGSPTLSTGVSVVYKVLNVDATVKMIDTATKKQILKDVVNVTPVDEYPLLDLEIGKPIKPIIDAEKAKPTNGLVTEYDYYTLIKEPEYEIYVDDKPLITDVVPDSDFDIIYKYQGEVGIMKVPVLTFGDVVVGNNSEIKNPLTNKNEDSTVELYNTTNKSEKVMTVELHGNIEKNKVNETDAKVEYNGELRYGIDKDNDFPIGKIPVKVLQTKAAENYSSITLKGSSDDKPGMYLNQFPGNYKGSYEGTLVWKIADDITK